MSWNDYQRNAVGGRARESEHSPDAHLYLPQDVELASQWFDRWSRFLYAERSTPQSQVLPAYYDLRIIAADGCDAGDDGDYDFDWWQKVVLPTLSVHVLGVDRHDVDEVYEHSQCAMHCVSVCVPFQVVCLMTFVTLVN